MYFKLKKKIILVLYIEFFIFFLRKILICVLFACRKEINMYKSPFVLYQSYTIFTRCGTFKSVDMQIERTENRNMSQPQAESVKNEASQIGKAEHVSRSRAEPVVLQRRQKGVCERHTKEENGIVSTLEPVKQRYNCSPGLLPKIAKPAGSAPQRQRQRQGKTPDAQFVRACKRHRHDAAVMDLSEQMSAVSFNCRRELGKK